MPYKLPRFAPFPVVGKGANENIEILETVLRDRRQGNTKTEVIVAEAIVAARVEHTSVSAIVPVATPYEPRETGIDEEGAIATPAGSLE